MKTFYGYQIALVDETCEGMIGTVKIVITEKEGKEPVTLWLRRSEATELAAAINQDVRRINAEVANR